MGGEEGKVFGGGLMQMIGSFSIPRYGVFTG
jgi:hypothetical protein